MTATGMAAERHLPLCSQEKKKRERKKSPPNPLNSIPDGFGYAADLTQHFITAPLKLCREQYPVTASGYFCY